MFCGKCGAQVPDGSAVCPNCGNAMTPKAQAPKMNQSFQNAGQGFNAAGTSANMANGNAPKKLDSKKIGMIAAAIVAVIVVIFIFKALFGGGGLKGTYTDGSTTFTFKGNRVTVREDAMEMSFKYKIKKDEFTIVGNSLKLSDETLEYLEDELGMDKDDIKELKESLEEDETIDFDYDKKNKVVTINKTEYYYADNYKVGPSGKYTSEDDDDISITFKNGKATFNNDGDKETFTYYCYDDGDDVVVKFYGDDFYDSDFYDDYYTSSFIFDDDDEVEIGSITYEK